MKHITMILMIFGRIIAHIEKPSDVRQANQASHWLAGIYMIH